MSEPEPILLVPITVEGSENWEWINNVLDFEDIDYIRYVVSDFEFIQAWCVVILVIMTNGPLIFLILNQVNKSSHRTGRKTFFILFHIS